MVEPEKYRFDDALSGKFIGDIDAICIALINAGSLQFSQVDASLSSPLLRWLGFRLRAIEPRKREIIYSRAFPRVLPAQAVPALEEIKRRIRVGDDISGYQSDKAYKNDVSNRRKKYRTDLMWANWGIHHLHLSLLEMPDELGFKPRADYLLFCIFDDETVVFLDVRAHREAYVFCNTEIVKNLIETCPDYAARFELIGLLPSRESYSAEETKTLWRVGMSTPIEVNGKVYMGTGGGITNAATPLRVMHCASEVKRCVRNLAEAVARPDEAVARPDEAVQTHVRGLSIHEPQFELALTEKGIVIYEAQSTVAWCKPSSASGVKNGANALAELNQHVLPDWLLWRVFRTFPESKVSLVLPGESQQ